jgi:hypothetical protein
MSTVCARVRVRYAVPVAKPVLTSPRCNLYPCGSPGVGICGGDCTGLFWLVRSHNVDWLSVVVDSSVDSVYSLTDVRRRLLGL